MLTREVIGQSCLGVVSLVNSSILSNEVKDTILEEQEEEIILMDYDEFDNWNETFTHRECDVMAMSYADFQAEKVNKEAVAGAGSTSSAVQLVLAPTKSTSVLTPHSTSVLHPTYVLPSYQSRIAKCPRHYW